MSRLYVWHKGEVLRFDTFNAICLVIKEKQVEWAVDTLYSTDQPRERYGSWLKHWEAVRLEDFPKEFRAHLLLLGVS